MLKILELVNAAEAASLDDLVEQLQVSPTTIRRDLAQLEAQNLLLRTHGGAATADRGDELPVALRGTRYREAKHAIAQATAALIPDGLQAVAMSGGTTTVAVALELVGRRGLTVVTNSLSIAGLGASNAEFKIMVTGGMLRPQSLELVGVVAESTFSAANTQIAILGADGVSAEAGITTHDETEARTNNAMVRKARSTIVVADGSKLGQVALAQMATVDQISTVVTDDTANSEELDRLRAAGVTVVVVPAESD